MPPRLGLRLRAGQHREDRRIRVQPGAAKREDQRMKLERTPLILEQETG